MPHVRLLPVTIFVALLMFMVRANDIWRGFATGNLGQAAMAQAETNQSKPQTPGTAKLPNQQQAQAPQPQQQQAKPPAQSAPPAKDAKAAAPKPPDAGEPSAFSQNELDVLQKLSERREGLDQRSRELDMREGLLKAAETRIDKKIDELRSIQGSIDALVKKYNEQEEAKMASLVKIYENMKPKDAARIFEQLDMPILLDVAERMTERKIAPILAEMAPAKAKSLTAELAQRRQMPKPATSDG